MENQHHNDIEIRKANMLSDETSHYEELRAKVDLKGDKFFKAITFDKSEYAKFKILSKISKEK